MEQLQILVKSVQGLKCESFSNFEKLELSFLGKVRKKSLWDAAYHVQHAV